MYVQLIQRYHFSEHILPPSHLRRPCRHVKKEVEDYHITGVAVMGKHFGGHVAVLAAQQQQITCAVALSPIVDWEAHSESRSILF